jgi:Tfp pilus assembly protein PilX
VSTMRTRRNPRGSAYVAVLGIGLLLAVSGAGAITVARVKSRNAALSTDAAMARQAATAMVEAGRAIILRESAWRSSRATGVWLETAVPGGGGAKLTAYSPSNDLVSSDIEPVILEGESNIGGATQRVCVLVEMPSRSMTSLNVSMAVRDLITLTSATLKTRNEVVTSNTGVLSTLSDVDVIVESSGTITGTNYRRATTTGAPPREIPGTEAFDWYTRHGVTLSISILKPNLLSWHLSDVLLSPQHNPVGATHPQGVYVLDCEGRTVIVTNVRIVGTLVLLNPGLGSALEGAALLEPAIPGFPVLMVRGGFDLRASRSSISEKTAGINFNPPGTPLPYPGGSTNLKSDDSFSPGINGLVFISGSTDLGGDFRINNLVVGGALTSTGGKVDFTYNTAYATSAPPGFRVVEPRLVPLGWWRGMD